MLNWNDCDVVRENFMGTIYNKCSKIAYKSRLQRILMALRMPLQHSTNTNSTVFILVPYLEVEQEILLYWEKPVGEKDFIIGHKSG